MKRDQLTAERLREVLDYDPRTGGFSWRERRGSRAPVGPVKSKLASKDGYARIQIDGVAYLAHRLAWLHHHGGWPAHNIDHRDQDPGNNRIKNLRDVAQAINVQNCTKAKSHNKSGVQGVSQQRGGTFHARITVAHVRHELGTYKTIEEARAAYLGAKTMLHPGWIKKASA